MAKQEKEGLPPEIRARLEPMLKELEEGMDTASNGLQWTTNWASYARVSHALDQQGGN